MVTSNIIIRTFRIIYNGSIGTAFTFDHNAKQYLITANHVVKGIKDSDVISITHNGIDVPLTCKLVGHGTNGSDITVLAVPQMLVPPDSPPVPGQCYTSEDVFILGFPYGWKMDDSSNVNNGFPFPFVKKGIVSSTMGSIPKGEIYKLFVDGHGNQGFSGGPLVAMGGPGRISGVRDAALPVILGIVVSMPLMPEAVFDQGKPGNLSVNTNTGFILCDGIEHAIAAIEANPIGFPVP